ncbi:unnamed protein product [Sphagnum troendelagicum]|uniref:Uncharacterized protein n=1 Tax=Sphagnum troendelagicum TaxID=128251 RepID=A0ABP0UC80_9BRYO
MLASSLMMPGRQDLLCAQVPTAAVSEDHRMEARWWKPLVLEHLGNTISDMSTRSWHTSSTCKGFAKIML